jgi:hypothetical protein
LDHCSAVAMFRANEQGRRSTPGNYLCIVHATTKYLSNHFDS